MLQSNRRLTEQWTTAVGDLWRVLYPVSFAVLLLVLALWAFTANEQGKDFFIGILSNKFLPPYLIKSGAALVAWSLAIWYSCRIVLTVKAVEGRHPRLVRWCIEWVPRILGGMPFLVFILALRSACVEVDAPVSSFLLNALAYLILGSVVFFFFVFRSRIFSRGIDFSYNATRFTSAPIKLKDLLKANSDTRIAVYVIVTLILACFILFLLPVEAGFARSLSPATVVILGFAFYTIVLGLIVAKWDIRQSPGFITLLLYIVLISQWNDNSSLRISSDQSLTRRETIEENLRNWLSHRFGPPGPPDTSSNQTKPPYPIYIIAAEGGGIRAMDWTALVMQKLQQGHPEALRHLYAVSGVSGGGVGSVFYNVFYRDMKMKQFNFDSATYTNKFKDAISEDFLSDVTAALIFQDNLQRGIFFPVEAFNRNRRLEDNWSDSYRRQLLLPSLDEPFTQIWKKDTALRYEIPNLFINGVLAESGQKAITSNLDFRTGGDSAFLDEIDVLQILGRDIPIKTAASLCSRFPLITSGGLLKRNAMLPVGHIVDGGYKENTGIETAWQLVVAMKKPLAALSAAYHTEFPLHLVFIRNSPSPRPSETDSLKPAVTMPDLATILSGFLNAWDRRTPTVRALSDKVFNDSDLNKFYHFKEIQLKRDIGMLPLGWYLSAKADSNIRKQVELVDLSYFNSIKQ